MQRFLIRSIFLILLLSAAESWALPPCPGSYADDLSLTTWTNCQGTYTYAFIPIDGDEYVGEWKDGKRHGQGAYTFANEDKYVGEWKDSLAHGQGTFTYADGSETEEGIWKDGEYAHSIVSVTNNLTGNRYRDGDGVLQNYQEALNFYLLSAEGGNKDAMLNIARLYLAGKATDTLSLIDRISDWWDETDSTTSRGHMKAYMWDNLAGDDLRDEIAESLTASELEKAQDLARECLANNYKDC
jgi:hypothetical protein